jgi:hypothetical protein
MFVTLVGEQQWRLAEQVTIAIGGRQAQHLQPEQLAPFWCDDDAAIGLCSTTLSQKQRHPPRAPQVQHFPVPTTKLKYKAVAHVAHHHVHHSGVWQLIFATFLHQ